MTSILENNSRALFVGEPTGESPNGVGDVTTTDLPNSGLTVVLTKVFWQTSIQGDMRNSIEPDIPVSYTHSDYISGLDPWLEAVESYENPKTRGQSVPTELARSLAGKYDLDANSITISRDGNELKMEVKRRMKNFFEVHSSLYFMEEGKLSSDIRNVFLHYELDEKKQVKSLYLDWKGVSKTLL